MFAGVEGMDFEELRDTVPGLLSRALCTGRSGTPRGSLGCCGGGEGEACGQG